MFGTLEILIIAVVALVLFGPDKLPELARSAGKAFAQFKNAQRAVELSKDFDLSGFDYYNTEHEAEKKKESDFFYEKIKNVAQAHDIDTENKTSEELLNLIDEKIEYEKQCLSKIEKDSEQ